MAYTIFSAKCKVSHIHRRMCEWDYTIDKSLVWKKRKKDVMLECYLDISRNTDILPNYSIYGDFHLEVV